MSRIRLDLPKSCPNEPLLGALYQVASRHPHENALLFGCRELLRNVGLIDVLS
jgi:hypothetical protein